MSERVIRNEFSRSECARLGLDGWETGIGETYGQWGEDLIVESLLRVRHHRAGLSAMVPSYIEIGANHPVVHSASYLLYRKYGGRGVLVEPIPALAAELAAHRPGDQVVNCAVSARQDETVPLHVARHKALSSLDPSHLDRFADDGKTVTDILTVPNLHINRFMERFAPPTIDLLSVDTEGVDLEILTALDTERFRPALIQCEPSGKVGPFVDMFKTRNYVLLAGTNVNLIFADALAILGLR